MRKEIKRTIQTGKATVEITMVYYNVRQQFGNMLETSEIGKMVDVKLFVNEKLVEIARETGIRLVDSEKAQFGNILLPAQRVIDIMSAIEEMHAEMSKEFAIATPSENVIQESEVAKAELVEAAKAIIIEIETRKTEILSDADEKLWRTNYNNVNNEGGEGYVPRMATVESVEWARTILNK